MTENTSERKKPCTAPCIIQRPSSDIKDCFKNNDMNREKLEALTCLLNYNEKCADDLPISKPKRERPGRVVVIIQKMFNNLLQRLYNHYNDPNMKDCLQPEKLTPFQALISELKNTLSNDYWNRELGKPRYHVPNLPVGMDPTQTTFGKKIISDVTMADLINPKTDPFVIDEKYHDMYRKSHHNYYPCERIDRK